MIHKEQLTDEILEELEKLTKEEDTGLEIPPAAFIEMQGILGRFDKEEQSLVCHFPVLNKQQNPFGNMQGGMITAAIDNTIGPLSMLIAEASVTRHMEVKYSKAVTPEMKRITVKARLVEQKKRFLFFEAVVTDQEGAVCTKAKSTHFIIT